MIFFQVMPQKDDDTLLFCLSSSLIWQMRIFIVLVFVTVVALTIACLADEKIGVQAVFPVDCEDTDCAESVGRELSGEQLAIMAKRFRYAIFGVMTTVLIFTIGVGFFVERRVIKPLGRMTRFADELAKGCLSQTITIDRNDEIGRVGRSLNDVAANIQELLLYSWNQAGNGLQCLENAMQPFIKENEKALIIKDLEQVGHCMENIRLMAESFDLFEVTLCQGILEADVRGSGVNRFQLPRNKGEDHV